jgi:hypothetical protein
MAIMNVVFVEMEVVWKKKTNNLITNLILSKKFYLSTRVYIKRK